MKISNEPGGGPIAALHRMARAEGVTLFTVTAVDRAKGLARRVYTSHPDEYPVSGTKPILRDSWSEMVLDRKETFVANAPGDYAAFFPDHALIAALGCGAAVNVPVLHDRTVVATVNFLAPAGHFTPARVARLAARVADDAEALCLSLPPL